MMKNYRNKGLMGAVIGDIVGSVYEWHNIKTKDFPFLRTDCFFTDDTVMSAAVAKALMTALTSGTELRTELVSAMQSFGRDYPHRGYGGRFRDWLYEDRPEPYNSWGNGAPMRCSGAGMLAQSSQEAYRLGEETAGPTHNHPHALTAAGTTAALIWMANHGASMEQLRSFAESKYEIPSCDGLRPDYAFDVSCQGTMPAALAAFLESSSFEDAVRSAVSLGGDSDTVAAITGSIAEAYWGIPDELWSKAESFLDTRLRNVVIDFYAFANGEEKPRRYRTETHMHTSETSDCARNSAAEIMEIYALKGYDTVFVTDHFSRNYLKYSLGRSYEEKVELFLDGYRAAKKAGDRLGITVLFGAELRLRGSRNHYLLYGLTREFLLEHPEIADMTIQEFYPLARANRIFVVQAHPFRRSCWPTPDCVDGMEIRNTNPGLYAPEEETYIGKIAKGYRLVTTAGSDTHALDGAGLTGIVTREKVTFPEQFVMLLRNGDYEII